VSLDVASSRINVITLYPVLMRVNINLSFVKHRIKRNTSAVLILLCLSLSVFSQLDLDFEQDRGYYSNPFNLTLSTNDPGATIRYTTNGIKPTPSSGTIYSSPISIPTTSYIRAIAYTSYDTTKVLTHTYIFPQDVVNQPNSKSGYPSSGFSFDNSIKNHSSYGPLLVNALADVPSLSLVMKLNDFFNVHELATPVEYETSVEILLPNGEKGYQANGGIERAGGSSFNSRKRNFRLSFKSIYGDSKFDFPLFGKDAAESFDQIALRPGFHGCMHLGLNHRRGGANDLADQVMRDLQGRMDPDGVQIHGSFMHLYINGIYWGVYNPTERGINSFAESYYCSDKENWDAVKSGAALDGNLTAWTTMSNMVNNLNMANAQNYQDIQEYVDVEQFTDYVLLTNYGPHADDHVSGKNSFATRDRTDTEGFKFWMWDTEPSLGHYWTWGVEPFGSSPFNFIFQKLLNNSDYKTLVGDRLQCHCFEDGALTVTNAQNTFDEVFDSTEITFLAEAARWAAVQEYNAFVQKRDTIVNDYLPTRTNFLINLYKNNGVYPSIDGVDYNQFGGMTSQSTQITLSNPNGFGTIYYTTNGIDPRASGGAISSSAQNYTGSFSFPAGVHTVMARVKSGSTWSAMCPVTFYVDQQYQDLVINEIHYNPNDFVNPPDTTSGRNFEFIEIKNCGSAPVDLKDMFFEKGIRLKFNESLIIQSNGFVVLAEDEYWFEQKYGFPSDASYKGKLSNSGENLWLVDPLGEIADSIRYNDNEPWPGTADKGYFSLALKDCALDNADGNNWSIQSVFTTPRQENFFSNFGEHGFSGLVINEIHYNPLDSIIPGTTDTIKGRKFEFVELKNISNISIDLSGTFFSRGIDYEFAPGTSIAAGAFIVLAEDKSSFQDRYGFAAFDKYDGQLDNGGESVWLNNSNGVLLDAVNYDDSFPWTSQADGGLTDYSLALINGDVDNDTHLNWKVQCNSLYTPGAENDFVCFSGLNYEGLSITEIHYSPSQGSNYEFLELYNNSNILMNLQEVRVSNAVTFKFDSYLLVPGNYIILARDSALFESTYGITPLGEYTGELSNNGETILVKDLFNMTIDSVAYGVANPWISEPLLGIKSLGLIDAGLDNNLPANWCVQQPNITPKSINIFLDNDNDSIVDCVDSCPGFDNNLIGTSCEDGNTCTTGETYDTNCNCTGGVFMDSDNDGVCDALDQCTGIDDAVIGQPCNDGDLCTVGETYNSNCQCVGGLSGDSDNDGICDAQDQCNGLDDALIGQTCSDGDPCTAGETYQADCSCAGGLFQDSDNDTVCDAQDQCPNFDNSLIGQTCDDGDNCTTGETYQTDCSCTGGSLVDANNNGVCDINESGCDILYAEDFESGSGIWESGGIDAARVFSANSPQGNYSYRIRDNSGLSSSVYSNALDMSAVATLKIGFNFIAVSLGVNESFSVQLSNDNGATFTTLQTWVSVTDFTNNVMYYEQVSIPAASLSNATVIRFECNASINSDEIFLDNIILESCQECVDNIIELSNPIIVSDASAEIGIQTNGKIEVGNIIEYHAGNYVELAEGFEVENGSTFHAFIQPCI